MFSKCLNWFLLGDASSTNCIIWSGIVRYHMVWYGIIRYCMVWYGIVRYCMAPHDMVWYRIPTIEDLLKGWSEGVFCCFLAEYDIFRTSKYVLKCEWTVTNLGVLQLFWTIKSRIFTLGWLFFENYEGTKTDIGCPWRHCINSGFITCTVIANDTIWVALFAHGNTSHPGTAPFPIKGAFSAHGCLCPWIVCAVLQAVQMSPHGCQIDSN